jgi:tRNA nucleotidyltransferase (CCA-adding enzyme)
MAMQAYLVGGAVRDALLGLPAGEKDWVVTGATPAELLAQGYRQVGESFPVFLHPRTGEEYALARTERKAGHGYHGFSVDFHPGVTLEQDLERRDLTINAMARDDQGRLIDPFGGQKDLEDRWLRHVSPAFSEDPLRVLRVARFAARFAPLGFRVHADTVELMRGISRSGELSHLVPERSWSEIFRAMAAPQPSMFVSTLRQSEALAILLPEVDALYGVPQKAEYHPEVDTGIHLELSLDMAAHIGCSPAAVFAVLLHDVGKGATTAAELPSHHGHERAGLPMVDRVCARLRAPTAVRRLALQVCEHHLRSHRILEARPAQVLRLLEDLDALRRPDLGDFITACEADFRGKGGGSERSYPQGPYLQACLSAALAVQARDLQTRGLDGRQIGERLRQARIAAIEKLGVDMAKEAPRAGSQDEPGE